MSFNKNKIIGICLILICCFFGYYQFISKPYFSIIVSSYNYGHYLPQTIESILNSTYQNFELIIVNDGSTDNTSELLKTYQNHPKITIIEQENLGLSIARNNAMKIAKGKYFWFVDADDWIDKNALALLWSKTKGKYIDLVSFYNVQSKNNLLLPLTTYQVLPTRLVKNPKKTSTLASLSKEELEEYPVTSGKQIYRRAFVEKHGIEFPPRTLFEDDVFFLDTIFKGAKISALTKFIYYKRVHDEAITSDKSKYFDSYLRICQHLYERITTNKKENEKAYYLVNIYIKNIFNRWASLSEERKYEFYPELEKFKNYIDKKAKTDSNLYDTKIWFNSFFNQPNIQKYSKKD